MCAMLAGESSHPTPRQSRVTAPVATRAYTNTSYRFGFHGKESDAEYNGEGNSYDFGDRILDTRIGRWLSVDPSATDFASWSGYTFALDNPIKLGDPGGADPVRL